MYHSGGGGTICNPPWQFGPKIAADLRPSADESAHLWWPVVAILPPSPRAGHYKTSYGP